MPVFRRLLPGLALLLPVTVLAVQPAAAQDGKDPWRITLGAGAAWAPDYLGSDDYDVDPLPVVDIRYRDRFFSPAAMVSASMPAASRTCASVRW